MWVLYELEEHSLKLRKVKSRPILDVSIDSAFLTVEIYSKPKTTFRSESLSQ